MNFLCSIFYNERLFNHGLMFFIECCHSGLKIVSGFLVFLYADSKFLKFIKYLDKHLHLCHYILSHILGSVESILFNIKS